VWFDPASFLLSCHIGVSGSRMDGLRIAAVGCDPVVERFHLSVPARRIQPREGEPTIGQIDIRPDAYLTTPPAGRRDDTTILGNTDSTADGRSSGMFAVNRIGAAAVKGS
jgi:hypothetical protein